MVIKSAVGLKLGRPISNGAGIEHTGFSFIYTKRDEFELKFDAQHRHFQIGCFYYISLLSFNNNHQVNRFKSRTI